MNRRTFLKSAAALAAAPHLPALAKPAAVGGAYIKVAGYIIPVSCVRIVSEATGSITLGIQASADGEHWAPVETTAARL